MIGAQPIDIGPAILDALNLRIYEEDTSVLHTLTAATMSDTAKAVDVCIKAFRTMEAQSRKEGLSAKETRHKAAIAFKVAMPPMDTREHVFQAIACVTNGMHLELISGADASKLLYAAQVAISLLRMEAAK